ncbi:branched-chain amino acid ABC transporter permease/ATP-binding protein [Streptomyces marispadix]|uniref:ATP-binding cassette domain-containing protein n=1 Tax=Streptomyces marispadix TaxID=2922868 RepID=A0ABS9T5Q5_9ACTN|nr:branched-chain amino acid ABC transporter permease/ATP-binding protein [Streptomyces marispadix]MCH6163841.1 ATP-binding cassette domain-containing protein [Streptomyces marispadix]
MTQALLGGLATGSVYALLGLGIVLVFSVSRNVNLAQGEFYVYGALIASTLVGLGLPILVAAVIAVVAVAVIAAVLQVVVVARMESAPHATQLLGSIGIALMMAGVARMLWDTDERSLPGLFDRDEPFDIWGLSITPQTIVLFTALAVTCALLWFLLTRTMLGAQMSAVAALSSRAGLLGIRTNSVARLTYAVAGGVGALAGIVVTPLVFVSYHAGLGLTISGFIAAAFGGLRSVRGAVAGGLLLGVLEATAVHVGQSTMKTPLALALLIVVLLVRSESEASGRRWRTLRLWRARRTAVPRLHAVAGRARPLASAGRRGRFAALAVIAAFGLAGPHLLAPYWLSVWTFVGVLVVVGVGLDLLLGYTGQLSLGQTTFMGASAYLVALAAKWWDASPLLAVAVAMAGSVAMAGLVGAVVLRLRGYFFTLATLAVAMGLEALADGLPEQLGGPSGLPVLTTLGIGPFALDTPEKLFAATWLTAALGMAIAARLVRSRFGYAMRTVGHDEALAAAVGASPFSIKLRVFCLSAAYAAAAGVLTAHSYLSVSPSVLGFLGGIDAILGLLLGGLGTVFGAALGIPLVRLLPEAGESVASYQLVIQGFAIVAIVLLMPRGLMGGLRSVLQSLRRRGDADATPQSPEAAAPGHLSVSAAAAPAEVPARDPRTEPRLRLTASGVEVRFGGIVALSGVDLEVAPGLITGLIGPNGAGKSTLLAVLAGSRRPTSGTVRLGERDLTGIGAGTCARLGIARAFQLPRIPPHMTVLEVAMLGTFRRGRGGILRSWWRGQRELAAMEATACEQLRRVGIAHLARAEASTLSTSDQKLLEVARALASAPEVLLLDEPAGGLFEDDLPRLAQLLRGLAEEGLAVVLVEHDMSLVMEVSDRIVVLNEGCVIADGPADVVRLSPEVIDAYLGV